MNTLSIELEKIFFLEIKVPLFFKKVDKTLMLTLYFLAISIDLTYKTFEPKLDNSNIFSKEINFNLKFLHILGSEKKTDSTSV
ncbi:hypothetical protein AMC76_00715 [Candidatus Carsonella ruddii]|nr:hypothetical protein AMC76_00715 [Candidatus Carsonella ruddii]